MTVVSTLESSAVAIVKIHELFSNYYKCEAMQPLWPKLKLRNMRLSQQPALGALTFLRSFVAGKANFCSHLLTSVVHFTVVKSQAILLIRLGVTEIIYHSFWGRRSYFRRNFISSASFKTTKFLPRWICSGTTILRVDSAYRSSL